MWTRLVRRNPVIKNMEKEFMVLKKINNYLYVFILLLFACNKSLVKPPIGSYLITSKNTEIKETPFINSEKSGHLNENVLVQVELINENKDFFNNITDYWIKIKLSNIQGWIHSDNLKSPPESIKILKGFFLSKKSQIAISFLDIPISGTIGGTMGCPGGVGGFIVDTLIINNPQEFILKLHYDVGDAELNEQRNWTIMNITNNSFIIKFEDNDKVIYEKSEYSKCIK